MSVIHTPRLPQMILDELEGRDWSIVPGRRHWRILVDGQQVALWAFGQGRGGHWTSAVNTRACIRRALRNRSK